MTSMQANQSRINNASSAAQAFGQIDLLNKDGTPQASWIIRKSQCSVGVGSKNDIVINHPTLAERHLTIRFGKNHTLLKAVDGETRVSGKSIREWLIDEATIIQCGSLHFLIHTSAQQAGRPAKSFQITPGTLVEQAAKLQHGPSEQKSNKPAISFTHLTSSNTVEQSKSNEDQIRSKIHADSASHAISDPKVGEKITDLIDERLSVITKQFESTISSVTASFTNQLTRLDEALAQLSTIQSAPTNWQKPSHPSSLDVTTLTDMVDAELGDKQNPAPISKLAKRSIDNENSLPTSARYSQNLNAEYEPNYASGVNQSNQADDTHYEQDSTGSESAEDIYQQPAYSQNANTTYESISALEVAPSDTDPNTIGNASPSHINDSMSSLHYSSNEYSDGISDSYQSPLDAEAQTYEYQESDVQEANQYLGNQYEMGQYETGYMDAGTQSEQADAGHMNAGHMGEGQVGNEQPNAGYVAREHINPHPAYDSYNESPGSYSDAYDETPVEELSAYSSNDGYDSPVHSAPYDDQQHPESYLNSYENGSEQLESHPSAYQSNPEQQFSYDDYSNMQNYSNNAGNEYSNSEENDDQQPHYNDGDQPNLEDVNAYESEPSGSQLPSWFTSDFTNTEEQPSNVDNPYPYSTGESYSALNDSSYTSYENQPEGYFQEQVAASEESFSEELYNQEVVEDRSSPLSELNNAFAYDEPASRSVPSESDVGMDEDSLPVPTRKTVSRFKAAPTTTNIAGRSQSTSSMYENDEIAEQPDEAQRDEEENEQRRGYHVSDAGMNEESYSESSSQGEEDMDEEESIRHTISMAVAEQDAKLSSNSSSQDEGEESEESIEAYMQRLLERVKGGSSNGDKVSTTVNPPAKPRPVAKEPPPPSANSKAMIAELSKVEPVDEKPSISGEVPARKSEPARKPRVTTAEEAAHLDRLRELANHTARSAITMNAIKRIESNLITKIMISAVGFFGGVFLLVINQFTVNIALVGMIACFAVFLIWGYDAITQRIRLAANRGKVDSET